MKDANFDSRFRQSGIDDAKSGLYASVRDDRRGIITSDFRARKFTAGEG
jgi:hypothetical protein